MRDLYIFADDLTGALDTGVRFAGENISVSVYTKRANPEELAEVNTSVAVENLDTRHLSPEEAYQAVYNAACKAKHAGFKRFYKKTDSALRGNPGAELSALKDAVQSDTLEFVPAFPALGRTTEHGIQKINGVPVSETTFGNDPFDPVLKSDIPQLLAGQTDMKCRIVPEGSAPETNNFSGINIYDAGTDASMMHIASALSKEDRLYCMAGCAGFAGTLPSVLPLEHRREHEEPMVDALLVVCGSMSPVSCAQLEYAEKYGFYRFTLDKVRRLDTDRIGDSVLDTLLAEHKKGTSLIVDVLGDAPCPAEELVGTRTQVADGLARIVRRLVDKGLHATVLATGGDTLSAVLVELGCTKICSMRELYPGIVLSSCKCRETDIPIISKAGSFGKVSLLTDIEAYLKEAQTNG